MVGLTGQPDTPILAWRTFTPMTQAQLRAYRRVYSEVWLTGPPADAPRHPTTRTALQLGLAVIDIDRLDGDWIADAWRRAEWEDDFQRVFGPLLDG